MTIHTGDGDGFLDNCEQATLSFDVTNTGAASQTNVRVTDVRLVSHPQIFLKSFNPITPSPDLAVCATGSASFDLVGGGLSFGDTVVVEVDLSSDELSPSTETATFSIDDAESDFQFHTSKTWDFESDLEGWTLIQGTFTRSSAGGGAGGSSFYVRSSSSSPLQCDQIRSPVMKLSATSTMTLYTNFDIESFSQGKWWGSRQHRCHRQRCAEPGRAGQRSALQCQWVDRLLCHRQSGGLGRQHVKLGIERLFDIGPGHGHYRGHIGAA